ncbi:MAG: hypothetical protein WDW36_001729 [Sanguina aurantia]
MRFLYRLEDSWGEVKPRKLGPHSSGGSPPITGRDVSRISESSVAPAVSTSSRPAEGIGSIASQGASWKPRTASVEPDGTDGDSSNTDFTDADDVHVRAHWALLLAGSAGWGNYRHQADVLHSYQVLLAGGLLPQHMVTMMFDDIAHNPMNPVPGKVFNRPGGPDVYGGVPIDYRGEEVNSFNYLAVLAGRKDLMEGVGTGRVLSSRSHDRVFLFYSDHGAPGLLGMPSGDFLYADQLLATLTRKHQAGGYQELVAYVEACESGSMFEGLLGSGLEVYATTASNAEESSWGTYCPGMEPGPSDAFGTCMGDLYSVAWMENAEQADLTRETLEAQFKLLQQRTSNNFTYVMGSHAMQYGSLAIDTEPVGDYLGPKGQQEPSTVVTLPSGSTASASKPAPLRQGGAQLAGEPHAGHHAVEQRAADLVHLRHRVARASSEPEREAAQAALDAQLQLRSTVDATARSAAALLLAHSPTSRTIMAAAAWSYGAVFTTPSFLSSLSSISHGLSAASIMATNALWPKDSFVEKLVSDPMGRPSLGRPLVDDWGCLRAMVGAWEGSCGKLDQYGMKHSRLFANLCNHGVAPAHLASTLRLLPACSVEAREARQSVTVDR